MYFGKELSRSDVELLIATGEVLGEGAFGTAYSVKWDGADTVLKVGKDFAAPKDFELEAYFLEKVNGAGGAPRLLAVSGDPPALLTTFAGSDTLRDLLLDRALPSKYLGLLGLQVCLRVKELHAIGVCHNDLHTGNIMVRIPDDLSLPPEVSLIDFGFAAYHPSALAQLPADDMYQVWRKTYGGRVATIKKDLGDLGDLLVDDIFSGMQEEAPESVINVAGEASLGHISDIDEIISALTEFF